MKALLFKKAYALAYRMINVTTGTNAALITKKR